MFLKYEFLQKYLLKLCHGYFKYDEEVLLNLRSNDVSLIVFALNRNIYIYNAVYEQKICLSVKRLHNCPNSLMHFPHNETKLCNICSLRLKKNILLR